MLTLITGGARSGKSTFAESVVVAWVEGRTLRDRSQLRGDLPQGSGFRDRSQLRGDLPPGSESHRIPEELAAEGGQRLEGPTIDYVATGYPASADDPDWADRVRTHQERRPADWRTIETLDVVGVLLADSSAPVLVDCVGLWLTRTADQTNAWGGDASAVDARVAELLDALSRTTRDVVLVTNEVGLGVVPDTASGRWFRDALGRLNVGLAQRCDEVWLCVAGIPVSVKNV